MAAVKLPPLISISPFEWKESSFELTSKLPSSITISEPAFRPLVLSSSSVVWVFPPKPGIFLSPEFCFVSAAPPAVILTFPLAAFKTVAACMPSLPEVISIFPVSIYTKPLFVFSVLVERIPSPPEDTVIAASFIFTQSLPSSAQPVLLTVRFNPQIIRSSFETAPHL